MPKKKSEQPPRGPVRLVVSREDAATRIEDRIDKGRELLDREIRSDSDLQAARDDYRRWDDFNAELLRQIFSTPEIADDYSLTGAWFIAGPRDFVEWVDDFRKDVRKKITRLQSVSDRLEIIPSDVEGVGRAERSRETAVLPSNRVFVVHGHNVHALEATARLLERLDLQPVVLHEQPNAGRTIIEKFEAFADVSFAVVLLTADDIGAPMADQTNLKPRPRQNVVFELGFFVGKLGRQHVCALYEEGVEILSDYQGVGYVALDAGGAWKFQLARELKQAGLEIDFNKVM